MPYVGVSVEPLVPNISDDLRQFYRWWWWQVHLPREGLDLSLTRDGLCGALVGYCYGVVAWPGDRRDTIYQEQRHLLWAMYGDRVFPFDASSVAYCKDENTHLNERRRAHVQQFL